MSAGYPGMPTTEIRDWPRAGGEPPCRARLRLAAADFQVAEVLNFAPSGEGQHVLVQIRKRNANTEWVAGRLARLAGVSRRAVADAGLKDRHALTDQWFSVDLAGREEPRWALLNDEQITMLQHVRHQRKLRHGAVAANRFRITLRDLQGSRDAIVRSLTEIAARGVPNYFGVQRFGRDNIRQAAAMLLQGRRVRDRFKRGIYLSAARSLLFNEVLALRVTEGLWDRALAGDVMMLEGSHSIFPCPEVDAGIVRRMAEGDLHATGPLWGRGDNPCRGAAAILEERALATEGAWRRALEAAGLKFQRRALRVLPRDFQWQFVDDRCLVLSFRLPGGCYATSVLRELAREGETPPAVR